MTNPASLLNPTLPQMPSLGGGNWVSAGSLGGPNHGLCTLSFGNRVFRFRTNPNEIWWSYDLITKAEDTYGGQVIQLLGTRLGDLQVKVEIGNGGWPYLMQVVLYLRDLMSDQRNGNAALFEYTTRNWALKVYSMTIPFADTWDATTREIELNFKVQEDTTGLLSKVTLDAELLRLQDGIYDIGRSPHNKYNDANQQSLLDSSAVQDFGPGGPSYSVPNIVNTVDSSPQGDNPGGLNLFSAIPGLPSIPGLSSFGL